MEPSLIFDTAVTLACQVEHALQFSKLLSGAAAVRAVAQRETHQRNDGGRRAATSRNGNKGSMPPTARACFHCGSTAHLANS